MMLVETSQSDLTGIVSITHEFMTGEEYREHCLSAQFGPMVVFYIRVVPDRPMQRFEPYREDAQ